MELDWEDVPTSAAFGPGEERFGDENEAYGHLREQRMWSKRQRKRQRRRRWWRL